MNNYKIKVNNEAESKEAQQLLENLGYEIECFIAAGFPRFVATTDCGEDYWYSTGYSLDASLNGFKELTIPQLRDLVAQSKPTEQGLISGADAKIAWAKGETIEYFYDEWVEITQEFDLGVFCRFDKFRIKPRTITLNVEIPAPFEPKDGEIFWFVSPYTYKGYDSKSFVDDCTGFLLNGVWRTEEEIKQVVAALRGGIKG